MDTRIFAEVSGLAFLDSLNPFTVAALAYLLGTKKPIGRSTTFILGTYVVYFLGGVLLLQGWLTFFRTLAPRVPPSGWAIAKIVLGVALAAGAVWAFRKAASGTPFRPPANLSLPATLVFAAVSTASDLPSAVPYFAAIARISLSLNSAWMEITCLAWYNFLYVSPMTAMMIAFIAMGQDRSARLFSRIRTWFEWGFAKLLPPAVAIGAVYLAYDGLAKLTAL